MSDLYTWTDEFGRLSLFKDDENFTRLHINNGLQFMERDEHRYHQSVFMLPSLFVESKKQKVLVLGGGDGLGARELLKLDSVASIDLVDISDAMIFMSTKHKEMTRLNEDSLNNKKVTVHIQDSNDFIVDALKKNNKWDLIILDYPDPSVHKDSPINHLFSAEHYRDVMELLNKNGVMAIQSTSVYISPNVFTKIAINLSKSATSILQLAINIQSFGDIGVIFARKNEDETAESKGQWALKHKVPKRAFFREETIGRFLIFMEDEKPTLDLDVIEEMSFPNLIKHDISSDFRRKENNYFLTEGVSSINRLIDVSEEEALRIYKENMRIKTKSLKEIFVKNSYLLGYPNNHFEELDEDDGFFKSFDVVRDKEGYIEGFLKIREDKDFIENEYIYIRQTKNTSAVFKLYYEHFERNNYKPMMITYWEHNILTDNIVRKLGGTIVEKGFTWNIRVPHVDPKKRSTESFKVELGDVGVFVYNGLLGCWETNWVDTKHNLSEIIQLCIDNNIPNLAIYSETPPVEFDYFKYKVGKLDFSKANKGLSTVLKRMAK